MKYILALSKLLTTVCIVCCSVLAVLVSKRKKSILKFPQGIAVQSWAKLNGTTKWMKHPRKNERESWTALVITNLTIFSIIVKRKFIVETNGWKKLEKKWKKKKTVGNNEKKTRLFSTTTTATNLETEQSWSKLIVNRKVILWIEFASEWFQLEYYVCLEWLWSKVFSVR